MALMWVWRLVNFALMLSVPLVIINMIHEWYTAKPMDLGSLMLAVLGAMYAGKGFYKSAFSEDGRPY